MLKTILLSTFLISINFITYGSGSPISKMEKENLLAAQQLGLISPDIAIVGLHESNLRSRRRAIVKIVFPIMGARCSICSLSLKTHYGGESKGERWCELNELILRNTISTMVTQSQIEVWKKEQSEIEKE